MARRLEGRVALITGAGSGIGRESALLFSAEGAAVVVVDRDDDGGRQTVESLKGAGGGGA
jgi:NAD(P)-dependent dehydrogenase (short-subunit alcohol dehydrogenase family)